MSQSFCGPAFPCSEGSVLNKIGQAAIYGLPETATVEEKDRAYIKATAQAAQGMSLRDYFAAKALATVPAYCHEDVATWGAEDFARHAYGIADAMLAARGES